MAVSGGPLQPFTELFSAPLEGVIVALGAGIAEAQKALDQNSIATQAALDSDPRLTGYGLQATWYQFPRVDLELKIALSVTQPANQPAVAPASAAGGAAILSTAALHLMAQPVNATYQNHFNYDAQATSTVRLSIVPVPAPHAADQSTIAPRLTPAQVTALALAAPGANFVTTKDAQNNTIPSPALRFDVHFNAGARTWYVMQFDPANLATKAVIVTVDDVTGVAQVVG
jgi:hypothetical protein